MNEIEEPVYVVGYVRVSTREQNLDVQIDKIKRYCKLRDWYLMDIYEDKASGKNTDRAGFQKMMNALGNHPYPIRSVVIYKLDRIGRSLSDLLKIVEDLKKKNIDLAAIENSIDTTTPQGKLFFQLNGAFAEYERTLILDRTEAGKQYAREKGVRFGRPPITERDGLNLDMGVIMKKIEFGVPKTQIARDLGIHRDTLYKLINNYKQQEEEDLLK
jgi:DNA invertase Pin-like site-specific DNA recombinase